MLLTDTAVAMRQKAGLNRSSFLRNVLMFLTPNALGGVHTHYDKPSAMNKQ